LKSIADPNDRPPSFGKGFDRRHNRGVRGQGTASKIVAVAKSAGKYHTINLGELSLRMPDEIETEAVMALKSVDHIHITIGTRELYERNSVPATGEAFHSFLTS
jgi:hypothetical protein